MTGLPLNLDDLLCGRVESQRLEFKEGWNPEPVIRTICAFANDLNSLNGGFIVLGVAAPEGKPVLPPAGLEPAAMERILAQIRQLCQRRMEPEYTPLLWPAEYQGKYILVIQAPPGDDRPYKAPPRADSGDRVYFVRVGAETIEAKGRVLDQLIERSARTPFDGRRRLDATVEDISPTLVRQFLHDVGSDLVKANGSVPDLEIYQRMRIVDRVNSHFVPRNVALMFFNDDPERFFPGARIEMAQFGEGLGGDLIEEKVIRGPIHHQVRQALDSLASMALIRKIPGQAEAERSVSFPYEAMEEAVVNAVYHRSYEHNPHATRIRLSPDRMEIVSYPGPVPGVEQRHLDGQAIPAAPARNPLVGDFLKQLQLAEKWGTGLPKIRRKMLENGSPNPIFEFDESRTYFQVVLPAHPQYVALYALRESARLWATGESASATETLQAAWEKNPAAGALAGQLIAYASESGDTELARSIFAKFLESDAKTDAAVPVRRFASALLAAGETAEARQVLEDNAKLLDTPKGYFETAILLKRAGDHAGAHAIFARAGAERANDPKVVHEFAQSKIALARAMRQEPTNQRVLWRGAEELLRRALQLSPPPVREAWCWYDLARVLAGLGEPNAEIDRAYLNAMKLLPGEARFTEAYQRWTRGDSRHDTQP